MVNNTSIGFSLILPTKNGGTKLKQTIEYIKNLQVPAGCDFEVIIIDNNSSDNSFELAKQYAGEMLQDIDWTIKLQEKQGKSQAIDIGVMSAKHNWIVLCDDDNLLFPDYLLQAIKWINTDSKIGILGGASFYYGNEEGLPWWFETYKPRYAIGTQQGYKLGEHGIAGSIWGAGMVFKKEVHLRILDLDFEMLTGKKTGDYYIAGEDYEFCILAQMMGYKCFYSSDLQFYHAIDPARISWSSFKEMLIRNCLPIIYLSMYDFVKDKLQSNQPINGDEYINKLETEISDTVKALKFKRITGKIIGKAEGYFYDADWLVKKAERKEIEYIKPEIDTYMERLRKLHVQLQKNYQEAKVIL